MIIALPKLAETTDVVLIDAWDVEVGDQVDVGDPLMTVETDKVTLDVPSPVAGAISRILVAEGAEIRTGEAICEITP